MGLMFSGIFKARIVSHPMQERLNKLFWLAVSPGRRKIGNLFIERNHQSSDLTQIRGCLQEKQVTPFPQARKEKEKLPKWLLKMNKWKNNLNFLKCQWSQLKSQDL